MKDHASNQISRRPESTAQSTGNSSWAAGRFGAATSMVVGGVGAATLAVLVAAAVGIGQDRSTTSPLDNPAHAVTAQQLSSTFRNVAKATFPGIVSIETASKRAVSKTGMDLEDLFGQNPQFEQFFKHAPELRRQFENRGTPRRQAPVQRGQGSGFIISKDGYILTNNHVVSNADEVKVRMYNGQEYLAEVIGVDPKSDVAVIKIEAQDLEPVPMGNSDQSEVGDFVLAFGNPFGLEMTMTQGIISAKGRGPGINEREDYLQTDAAINPGNSGGPLVNLQGEVIGINTAISSRSGGYDGVGFAIPINMARWSADQIIATGHVKRAYIGVKIQSVTSDLAEPLGVDVNHGAVVTEVLPDSPADKAGLKAGDVILKLDGHEVSGTRELQGIVERLNVNESYPLLVQRDGKQTKLKITMAQMPDTFTVSHNSSDEQKPESAPENSAQSESLGLQVQELTAELAEQFGYEKDVVGVIVSSVKPDSVAAANGLQEGEVIEKINQTSINSLKDFEAAMSKADVDKGVLMLVRRGEVTRFLVVKDR